MKKISILLIFLFSLGFIKSQENENIQFVKSFVKVVTYDFYDKSEKTYENDVTFIFNFGTGKDIKQYVNGTSSIFKRVSGVEKGTTDEGEEYQFMKILDEEGTEVLSALFDDGIYTLVYLSEESEPYLRFTFIPANY